MKTAATMAMLAILVVPVQAQIQGDPKAKMQEILDALAQEMKQIDQWLLESSKSKDAAKGMQRNMTRMNELLDSVGKSQKQVVKNIDDLLKEAEKLKKQGEGKPQESMSKKGQKQRQQQPGEQKDRTNQPPRKLQKPEPTPQETPEQNQKNQQPRDENKPERDKGKNVGSRDPKKGDTEQVNGKKLPGAWGTLPDYVLKHGRGSMPDVPEKYRKYLEAITKQGDKKQ